MYQKAFNTKEKNCRSSQLKITSVLYTVGYTDTQTSGRTDRQADSSICRTFVLQRYNES